MMLNSESQIANTKSEILNNKSHIANRKSRMADSLTGGAIFESVTFIYFSRGIRQHGIRRPKRK